MDFEQHSFFWQLELQFDSNNLQTSELSASSPVEGVLGLILSGQFEAAVQFALKPQEIWSQLETALVMDWAVKVSETVYNLSWRKQLLAQWENISDWSSDPFLRGLRCYHEAMADFFAANLREANAKFRISLQNWESCGYKKGQLSCLFHLGLVERDRQHGAAAEKLFKEALQIAESLGSVRFQARIRQQLGEQTDAFERIGTLLVPMLREQEILGARMLLAKAERLRRRQKIGRRRYSFYRYLFLIATLRGKEKLAALLLQRTSDPLIKIECLQLKSQLLRLSPSEQNELVALQQLVGINAFAIEKTDKETFFQGLPINGLADEGVRLLIALFSKNPTRVVSKEEICRGVWNIEYDPLIHDNKIHKLIYRARRSFPRNDFLINTYGGYQISPQYL